VARTDDDTVPDPDAATIDEDTAAASADYGAELLAGQTPQQQEIAGRIYERLKAGAELDDVKDLIAELSRTATADQQRRQRDQSTPPGQDSEEWNWQWETGR
jgi:hypothetical protein